MGVQQRRTDRLNESLREMRYRKAMGKDVVGGAMPDELDSETDDQWERCYSGEQAARHSFDWERWVNGCATQPNDGGHRASRSCPCRYCRDPDHWRIDRA